MYGPHVAILLMFVSRNTRRVDFRRLTGSQRTPRVWGVTILPLFRNLDFFIICHVLVIVLILLFVIRHILIIKLFHFLELCNAYIFII